MPDAYHVVLCCDITVSWCWIALSHSLEVGSVTAAEPGWLVNTRSPRPLTQPGQSLPWANCEIFPPGTRANKINDINPSLYPLRQSIHAVNKQDAINRESVAIFCWPLPHTVLSQCCRNGAAGSRCDNWYPGLSGAGPGLAHKTYTAQTDKTEIMCIHMCLYLKCVLMCFIYQSFCSFNAMTLDVVEMMSFEF